MLSAPAQEALSILTTALSEHPELGSAVRTRWLGGSRTLTGEQACALADEVRLAADRVAEAFATESYSADGVRTLTALFSEPKGELLFTWCAASTWRTDANLAEILARAAETSPYAARTPKIARARIVEGPLLDALRCVPLLGRGEDFAKPENTEARSRLEILIWEAGARALEVPELGHWLWQSRETFEAIVGTPAQSALRGRVLAARCLEIAALGMPPRTEPPLVDRTLQVLQPLLLHPEPLVWIHAARALGRLTASMPQLEGTLLDWVGSSSPILRLRALTAVASLPESHLTFLAASQLVAIVDAPDEDSWVLAAVAAATPYLFFSRRDLWDRVATRILGGEGGAIAARGLTRSLNTLWRRGDSNREIEGPLRKLREMARTARPTSLDDARRWIEVIAFTDTLDDAERDPLDLELGLENLVRVAAQYDDEEADARAARFAATLARTFEEAMRIALGTGRPRQRAGAMNALEGCTRALALRLWGPLLATRPAGEHVEEPDLEETWKVFAGAASSILDEVKRRREHGAELDDDLALEVLSVRLGSYALDACGEDSDLGPGRGATAHETCLWLRKLEGLEGGARVFPDSLKRALSALLWRLVDATRGTALGEVDDLHWLGPFAAWWALVIDRPSMLLQLANALPMMAEGSLLQCVEHAETLRTAVLSNADNGDWGPLAASALEWLHADETELAHATSGLAGALASFATASGPKAHLDAMCINLVLAGNRLHEALSDPGKALGPPTEEQAPLSHGAIENMPRVAALVARAIRTRDASMLDVWFASLAPAASTLLEAAVRAAIRRTPPPPPKAKAAEPKTIAGYELVRALGEGGMGTVWLVRKPGADRLFVLKTPKAEALANATDTERTGILASFTLEAQALAGLYHPNVANIIDRGVANDIPFLILEYLIGADLKEYSSARPMTLFELRQVVLDTCAGLSSLHNAGLVHRDIKPANLWLRLPLRGGERFDATRHRDPAIASPLATVVIDFGMVRTIRVPPDASGRFVAGTAGYIAPEQVLDPVELDPRSDVYALAGTIYNVTTGRAFFDDIENPRDRIVAHMRRDPFEDTERLSVYPAAIAKLLRQATSRQPNDRPSPFEFGNAFAASL